MCTSARRLAIRKLSQEPGKTTAALGKVVGVEIELATKVPETPSTPAHAVEAVDYIWITTYQRERGRSVRTFWSSEISGHFSWQRNRLILDAPTSMNNTGPVFLDLTFDSRKSEWRGRLQNQWYAGDVVLKRPYVDHIGFKIIGDWLWRDYSCKHIFLGSDSTLVIWTDLIRATASGPAWYGDFDMDPETKYIGTKALFFTGTDRSGDVVMGKVDDSGDTFVGEYVHFGNGIFNEEFTPMTWRRTTPDCRG